MLMTSGALHEPELETESVSRDAVPRNEVETEQDDV